MIVSVDYPIQYAVYPKDVIAILLMAMKTAMALMIEDFVPNLLVGLINSKTFYPDLLCLKSFSCNSATKVVAISYFFSQSKKSSKSISFKKKLIPILAVTHPNSYLLILSVP